MKLLRPMLPCKFPSLPDDQRLIKAFIGLWPAAYEKAVASVSKLASGAAHITGTILVASANDVHGAARVHVLDFAAGTYRQSANEVEADGQEPSMFTNNARVLMGTMRQSNQPFQVDEWGIKCVADAISAYPNNVGWPVDIILARAAARGERLTYDIIWLFLDFYD